MQTQRIIITISGSLDPERQLPMALRALERHPQLRVLRCSRVYHSAPGNGDAHTMAVVAETAMPASGLLGELAHIERVLRGEGSELDLERCEVDLRLFVDGDGSEADDGSAASDVAEHLVRPIADVAPDWIDPSSGLPVRELVAARDAGRERTSPEPQLHRSDSRYATDLEALPEEVYAPRVEALVRQQLVEMGEDPAREGLERTPLRVAKALDFLTSGYTTTLEDVVNQAIFEEPFNEMVVVKDIEFYSLCEHHLLPFFGRAHVAYLPDGKIIGLSKIARIVDLYARRLQVQERLANQVADALMQVVEPQGVAVVMEGSHFCMMMRGVQKQNTSMVTSAMRGTFLSNAQSRAEFLALVKD